MNGKCLFDHFRVYKGRFIFKDIQNIDCESVSFLINSSLESLIDIWLTTSNNSFDNVVPFTFDNKESWHSLNFKGFSKRWGIVNINCDQRNFCFLVFFMNIRSNVFAWSTPISKAVNNCNTSVLIKEFLNFFFGGCFEFWHLYLF